MACEWLLPCLTSQNGLLREELVGNLVQRVVCICDLNPNDGCRQMMHSNM